MFLFIISDNFAWASFETDSKLTERITDKRHWWPETKFLLGKRQLCRNANCTPCKTQPC